MRRVDINGILKRLKIAINAISDKQLADYLGIHPTTIHSWKKRGMIGNWEVIFDKFSDKDLNWIIYGEKSEEEEKALDEIFSKNSALHFSLFRVRDQKKKYPDYEELIKDIVKKLTFIDQYRLFKIAKVLLEIEEETR